MVPPGPVPAPETVPVRPAPVPSGPPVPGATVTTVRAVVITAAAALVHQARD